MPSTPGYKLFAGGVVLLAVGFALGTIYANWAYDYYLLWVSPTTPEMIAVASNHYKMRATQPVFLHHVLHTVLAMGILGLVVKLYRATESNTLFDGGSLVLFVIAIVFYITNLRPAAISVTTGDWNDIDEETGVKFISATQVLIVFALIGVLALQFGQSWAEQDVARLEARVAADNKAADAETKDAAVVEAPGAAITSATDSTSEPRTRSRRT